MKRGPTKSLGFTIVETMIFLAVSSALLASALTAISGSQNRTEFSQAINDLNQQINQVMTNVANGYYANTNNFTAGKECKVDPTDGPYFVTGAGQQGTNDACLFIGRAIQFQRAKPTAQLYSLVAQRIQPSVAGDTEVTDFSQAKARIIEKTGARAAWPSATEQLKIRNGLEVARVQYENGAGIDDTGGVVFYSSLAGYESARLSNGARQVDFSHIPLSSIDDDEATFMPKLEQYSQSVSPYTDPDGYDKQKNPSKGVWICVNSGGTNQHATITIGGKSGQTATVLVVHNGRCPSDGDNSEFGL